VEPPRILEDSLEHFDKKIADLEEKHEEAKERL
jgi:hypothetical protein